MASTELYTLRELVQAIADIMGTRPERFCAPVELLAQRNVQAEHDIPLWWGDRHVIWDVSRAKERLGFRSTPLAETLRHTLDAYQASAGRALQGVMDPDVLWARVHDLTP